MNVDLITFCCPKDIHKLHAPGVLESIVDSHGAAFREIIVVHQRCRGIPYSVDATFAKVVESEDYPNILSEFGVPEDDLIADKYTHGPSGPHYWKYHVMNHLIGLKESRAEYIVFSDCDCNIIVSPERSWVAEGISILNSHPEVLIVSPGDGGSISEGRIPEARLTKNVSQQLFLCRRSQFCAMDFDAPWNGEFDCIGGPFPEYYFMLEGRIWRWLLATHSWRAILPDTWRYWHHQW